MSDLQCPATVLVVRHGESEGNLARRLSSAAPGSTLSRRGREQARALGELLRDRRVARVYASPLRRAQQTAQELAEVLGVDVVTLPDVREVGIGSREDDTSDLGWDEMDAARAAWLDGDLDVAVGGGESAADVLARVGRALDELADLHRGETVVVVSHAVAMEVALPRLTGAGSAPGGRQVPNAGVVELERDADGWRLLRWPEPPAPPADRLVDLLGRADAASQRASAPDWTDVSGAVCTHLPVPYPWGTRAWFTAWPDPPTRTQVQEAVAWCESTSPGSWRIGVRGEHAAAVLADADGSLQTEDTLQVRATTALDPPTLDPSKSGLAGLEIAPAWDADEFLEVYGADLAPLVRGRLGTPGMLFLVGRLDGGPVACARVWDVGGTSYVSAVQVRPEHRRRGIGRAVSAAATRLGLHRHAVAWLTCEPDVAPLYAALGYQPVTTHVHLGPAARSSPATVAR